MRAPPEQAAAVGEGEMEIAAIDLGERAGRDMGDLDRLMVCIAGEGLKHPVTVSPAGRLVLGARRLEACRRLGWRHTPAETIVTVQEALDRIAADHVGECCTHPLTVVEAIGMEFAVRELQWWPRDGSTVKSGRRDERREEMARAFGLNGRQYTIARMLVLASRDPATRDQAMLALSIIRTPSDMNAALRLYRGEETPRPVVTDRGPRRLPSRRLPSRSQEDSISSALGALAGITTGLAGATPLDPAIPAATRARWARDTDRAIRVLTKFRKELRSHDTSRGDSDD